jgi:hypothetical protein
MELEAASQVVLEHLQRRRKAIDEELGALDLQLAKLKEELALRAIAEGKMSGDEARRVARAALGMEREEDDRPLSDIMTGIKT